MRYLYRCSGWGIYAPVNQVPQSLPHIVDERAEAKRTRPCRQAGTASWGDLGTNPMFPWLSLRRGADGP